MDASEAILRTGNGGDMSGPIGSLFGGVNGAAGSIYGAMLRRMQLRAAQQYLDNSGLDPNLAIMESPEEVGKQGMDLTGKDVEGDTSRDVAKINAIGHMLGMRMYANAQTSKEMSPLDAAMQFNLEAMKGAQPANITNLPSLGTPTGNFVAQREKDISGLLPQYMKAKGFIQDKTGVWSLAPNAPPMITTQESTTSRVPGTGAGINDAMLGALGAFPYRDPRRLVNGGNAATSPTQDLPNY